MRIQAIMCFEFPSLDDPPPHAPRSCENKLSLKRWHSPSMTNLANNTCLHSGDIASCCFQQIGVLEQDTKEYDTEFARTTSPREDAK